MATAPALDLTKEYAICYYENSSPTVGDAIKVGPLYYNPRTGKAYTDSVPVHGNAVITVPVNAGF